MRSTNNTSFIGNSALILIVRSCNIVSILLVMLLMSNVMSVADYGAFQTFWIQISVLSVLCGLGIPAWSFTYNAKDLSFVANSISRSKYFLYFFGIFVVALSFSIYQVFNNTLFDNKILILTTAVYFICFTLNVIVESLVIICRKFKLLLALSILYAVLYSLIHIAYIYGYIEWSMVMLALMSIAITKFCLLFFSIKNQIFSKKIEHTYAPAVELKAVKKLWLNIGFNDVFQSAFRWVDKVVVSIILSAEIAAIYVNATFEIPIFALVASSVYSASLIKLNSISGKNKEIISFLRNTSTLLGIFTFSSLCYFFFFAEEFLTTVFSEKYLVGVSIFLVSIFKLPCKSFNLTGYLQHANKGNIINKGSILDAIITLALMYPLYLLWGLHGMALSIVISTIAQVLYYNYHSAKLLSISPLKLMPFNLWFLQIIAFGLLSYVAHLLLINTGMSSIWVMLIGLALIGTIALLWMAYSYRKLKFKM